MNKYEEFDGEEHIYDWPSSSPQDFRRKENALVAVRLMMNAALTAPSGCGISHLEGHIVYGQAKMEKIARKIEELAYKNARWEESFKYEAVMVRESDVVLFLGTTQALENPHDLECGLCGGTDDCSFFYERRKCKEGLVDVTERKEEQMVDGPLCVFCVQDLGYGVGSALWMANTLMVDTRPLISVGMAGRKLGYCPDSPIVVGLPVAALAKNPYVDVNPDYHLVNMEKVLKSTRIRYMAARTLGGVYFDHRKRIPKRKKEE